MRSTFVCVLTLLICNLSYDLARRQATPLDENGLDENAALLAPIEVGPLTLIPIVAIDPSPDDDVMSLDEAMRSKLVRVSELGDEGRVDMLLLSNESYSPVFVLAGEIILGGKQDRVIATNTVIPPNTALAVPVRCIEHGRWDGKTTQFTTASTLAHDRLRGTATYASQADVWSEVTAANQRHGTTNPTDTYRLLAQRQETDVATRELAIHWALYELPAEDRRRMIGYVIAYEGEVAGVDMFATPHLFEQLEKKLLRSYLAEATRYTRTAKPPCVHDVREFIANARRGAAEKAFDSEHSTTLIKRGTLSSTSEVQSGDRHLYSNYLGNNRVHTVPGDPSYLERNLGGQGYGRAAPRWVCDRHLYPGYVGNQPATNPDCWDPPTTDPYNRYPNYLGGNPGNQRRPCNPYLGVPPTSSGRLPPGTPGRLRRTHEEQPPCEESVPYERRLYPSYLGNNPGGQGRNPFARDQLTDYLDFLASNPRLPGERLFCERSMYPGYIGNTAMWNECRRALGLPVGGVDDPAAPEPVVTEQQRLDYLAAMRAFANP